MIVALKQVEAGRRVGDVAREKPRYGYRRLHVLSQRGGEQVNQKRVYRVYREAGLCLRRKKRKHCAQMQAALRQHTGANQEWALDFVHDTIAPGCSFRVLSVVDAYTRECLALEVDTSFASRRVTRVLDEIAVHRGRPLSIRCDNGPELTSRHFLAWCLDQKIELVHERRRHHECMKHGKGYARRGAADGHIRNKELNFKRGWMPRDLLGSGRRREMSLDIPFYRTFPPLRWRLDKLKDRRAENGGRSGWGIRSIRLGIDTRKSVSQDLYSGTIELNGCAIWAFCTHRTPSDVSKHTLASIPVIFGVLQRGAA